MTGFLTRLFRRPEPSIAEANANDAVALAQLHGTCFNRGWNEHEFERLLTDRAVLVHRITIGPRLAGFIVSRIIAGEAEILSVAVASARRRRGLATQLLNHHLRRLASLGSRTVFLEVDESNVPANRLYQHFGFRTVGRREGYYPDQLGRPRGSNFPGQKQGTAALVLRCDMP